jgi:hypothetical protein
MMADSESDATAYSVVAGVALSSISFGYRFLIFSLIL